MINHHQTEVLIITTLMYLIFFRSEGGYMYLGTVTHLQKMGQSTLVILFLIRTSINVHSKHELVGWF